MKPSKIALLWLGGIVVATIVVVAVAARVNFGGGPQESRQVSVQVGSSPGEPSGFSHDLSGFDSIEIKGRWTLTVTQGDNWLVEMVQSENGSRDVDVSVHEGRLKLSGARSGSLFGRSDARLTANIMMPALVELATAGENRVAFSGFKGERLAIEAAGATDMTGCRLPGPQAIPGHGTQTDCGPDLSTSCTPTRPCVGSTRVRAQKVDKSGSEDLENRGGKTKILIVVSERNS